MLLFKRAGGNKSDQNNRNKISHNILDIACDCSGWNTLGVIKMNKTSFVLVIFMIGVVAGCSPTETIVYTNTTKTIVEYINTTGECDCPDAQYISRLLRDYNRCKSEMKYFNETDLKDLSYDLNVSLIRCRQKVEDLKDLI